MCEESESLKKALGDDLVSNSGQIDWEALCSLLKYHKLHMLFYHDYQEIIPDRHKSKFAHEYYKELAWQQVLLEEFKLLTQHFKKADIPFILLKGFTIDHAIYGFRHFRPTSDLDLLLLRTEDLAKAQDLVEEDGYSVFYKKKDYTFGVLPTGYRMKHVGYHESQYSKVIEDGYFIDAELHLDTGSIGPEIIESFKKEPESIQLGGTDVLVMNRLHFFLYLCANTQQNFEINYSVYNNTYLRDVLDVVLFVKKHIVESDWGEILRLSKKYHIYHMICAVVYYAVCLAGKNVLPVKFQEMFQYTEVPGEKHYANGSSVPWEMSFIDRVFDAEKRCTEYSRLYVEHCFSAKNPNSSPAYPAFLPDPGLCVFHNHFFQTDLTWKFQTNGQSLQLSIFDLKGSVISQENYLALKFLTRWETAYQNGGNPLYTFYIQKNDRGDYELIDEDGNLVSLSVERDNTSVFSIPLSMLYLYHDKYIAYNLLFCRRIFKDCLEWCGGIYEDYNPKGELGVIQIHP